MNKEIIKILKYRRLKPIDRFIIDTFTGLNNIEENNKILYKKNNIIFFIYDLYNNIFWCEYDLFWKLLENKYNIYEYQITEIIKNNVKEYFNIDIPEDRIVDVRFENLSF